MSSLPRQYYSTISMSVILDFHLCPLTCREELDLWTKPGLTGRLILEFDRETFAIFALDLRPSSAFNIRLELELYEEMSRGLDPVLHLKRLKELLLPINSLPGTFETGLKSDFFFCWTRILNPFRFLDSEA